MQSFPFEHVLHCIDALRLEVLCNADDIPRYNIPDGTLNSGIGQHRQCKDWSKLESWAQEHSACYKYLNYSTNTADDQKAARMVFCPAGSPYQIKVEEYLRLKDEKDM